MSIPHVQRNVLLVGQLYLDTILCVDKYPEEDTKIRANQIQQRLGGNTCNTAQVLTQFQHINVCYMSAVGSRETSNHIIDILEKQHIQVKDTILYRENTTTPSSTIIHNESTGSRTIISHTNVQDLTCNEFNQMFTKIINKDKKDWWVHFEGRNITETIQQIHCLNTKAINGHLEDQLIISVELEKPERKDIELLIDLGDIIFFSKIFAQHHGFQDATSFLKGYSLLKEKLKPSAIAFCTWGSQGASVLDNKTGKVHSITPNKTQVMDTVGAGDTFNAGVMTSYTKATPIMDVLSFACNLATKKVSQSGFENLVSSSSY